MYEYGRTSHYIYLPLRILILSIMKNRTKRRIHRKFHSVNRKHRKSKRKYFSKYERNKKNKLNNPPHRSIKKNILSVKNKCIGGGEVETSGSPVEDINQDKDVLSVQDKSIGNTALSKNVIPEKTISCSRLPKESLETLVAAESNGVKIPEIDLIVEYHWLFDDPVPKTREERLQLIVHIPKDVIIHNLASFNYLQREFGSFTYDISDKLQWDNLTFWLNIEKSDMYKKQILQYLKKINQADKSAIIFNRQANLFILQEVIYYGSDLDTEGFKESEVMEDIFKYYLSVNSLIVNEKEDKYEDKKDNEETERNSALKSLTASHLFIDTLRFANNPIFILERYPELIHYLRSKPELNKYFANYFSPFGYDPEQLLKYIAELYFNLPNSETPYLAPFISIPTDDPQRIKILDSISELRPEIDLKHDFDLSRIKKSPLYKVPGKYYVILDHDFLIQKIYQFAINDYFFDYLKPNDAVNYAYYAAEIGLFFENYVSDILRKTFKGQDVTLKTLDELKMKVKDGEIELADFYLREDNNIILGQVKASALNTEQNRGTVESLFTKEKDFLSDFGLIQTFETIQYLKTYPNEFDIKDDIVYTIYPVIVLNEAITSSLAVHLLFNDEFNSWLKSASSSFPNFKFRYITLLHIQDLERISPSVKTNTYKIWDILDFNMVNRIPIPLDVTLNKLGISHIPIKKADDYKFMKFANYNRDIK